MRPLEFRWDESKVFWYGLAAVVRPSDRIQMTFNVTDTHEDRERPDAAAIDWNQLRASARITLLFGSGADHFRLPPAVRRPSGRW